MSLPKLAVHGAIPDGDVDRAVPQALDVPAQVEQRDVRATYAQRLERRARTRRSCLCVGIDPAPESLGLLEGTPLGTRTLQGAAIERFCAFVTESARDRGAAVKFQLAWFELAGVAGMRALERAVAYARTADLLVVIDGKRGDVPHSADAYARAWIGVDAESGCGGDALTVNASLGADTLGAFTSVAHARHAQVYALVHTSNAGAPELQAASIVCSDAHRSEAGVTADSPPASAEPWWHRLARIVESAGAGAVVGATHVEVLAQARQLLPTAPLLVPGIGAQGGSFADLAPLATSAAPPTLVSASRSLLPTETQGSAAFRAMVSARIDQLADSTALLLA